MAKVALVTGGAGQDGWYLIQRLLSRGYAVHAHSRRRQIAELHAGQVHWHIGNLADPSFLESLIESTVPDEIYNLAAVSRPVLSWSIPFETAQLNALVPQHLCQILLKSRSSCRLFQATSSEIFGDSAELSQNEESFCVPKNPYGLAKYYAHRAIGLYREQYGLHLSSGIMFNHESPRRPLAFVSQKIAHAAAATALGLEETTEVDEQGQPLLSGAKVRLGDLDVRRDFGFAGDYVDAMHLMLQSDTPDDYVIGTGEHHSIAEFCEVAFRIVNKDWKRHVVVDSSLVRKSDSHYTHADISKIRNNLGWRPKTSFEDLVSLMVHARIDVLKNSFSSAISVSR